VHRAADAGLSQHVDLKLVSRLDFGSGTVTMRYEPRGSHRSPLQLVARALDAFEYERLYNNFGSTIPVDAKSVVRRSADRHAAWVPLRLRPPDLNRTEGQDVYAH
jgi:hypothetical protein